MSWTPTPSDIIFSQQLAYCIKEGGVWMIPSTGQLFRFVKSRKEIHLFGGPDTRDGSKTLKRLNVCYKQLGYEVLDVRGGLEKGRPTGTRVTQERSTRSVELGPSPPEEKEQQAH